MNYWEMYDISNCYWILILKFYIEYLWNNIFMYKLEIYYLWKLGLKNLYDFKEWFV